MNEYILRRMAYGGDTPPEDADWAYEELRRLEDERTERAAEREAREEADDER